MKGKIVLKVFLSAITLLFVLYSAVSCVGFMIVLNEIENPILVFLPMLVVILFAAALVCACVGSWVKGKQSRKSLVIAACVLAVVALILLLLGKTVYMQFSN